MSGFPIQITLTILWVLSIDPAEQNTESILLELLIESLNVISTTSNGFTGIRASDRRYQTTLLIQIRLHVVDHFN